MKHSNRLLYSLLSLQGLSLIGSRITSIAVGIWVVLETGSVTPLLMISLFHELPLLLLGTGIGWVVDRWKRKTAIIVGDIGQAICTVILITCLVFGSFELWYLYFIVSIQGIFAALQSTATAALIPLMTDDSQLDRANSAKEMLFPLAGVISPFIAGMLIEPIGLIGIVIIDAVSFAICIGVTVFLPLPEIKNSVSNKHDEKPWVEAVQGYRYIWKHKPLLYLFLYFALWDFILNGPLELAIPFFISITESNDVMSWLLSVMNAGALAGAILAVTWGDFRYKIKFIFIGSILTSSMFVLVGGSQHVWVMAMALFLLMLPLAMTGALFSSLLQRNTPQAMHGRIFAAYGQLTALTAPCLFSLRAPWSIECLNPLCKRKGGRG